MAARRGRSAECARCQIDRRKRIPQLAARLDRAAGDMNAFLLVLAIGLATLD